MIPAQSTIGNLLLNTMRAADFGLVAPHLVRIALPVRLQLHEAGGRIEKTHFPEDGIISIVAVTAGGDPCEVGLFGREGMSETASVLGTDHAPHESYVQSAGRSSLQLPTAILHDAMGQSATLRLHLLKYVQAMIVQLSTSITASRQTIGQRLARWLLMCHDRVDGDEIPLTHEFIAMMLSVRRAGVTIALGVLADAQIIDTRRATVIIRDRTRLEQLAGTAYGLAESEYERLIGVPVRRVDNPATEDIRPAA